MSCKGNFYACQKVGAHYKFGHSMKTKKELLQPKVVGTAVDQLHCLHVKGLSA